MDGESETWSWSREGLVAPHSFTLIALLPTISSTSFSQLTSTQIGSWAPCPGYLFLWLRGGPDILQFWQLLQLLSCHYKDNEAKAMLTHSFLACCDMEVTGSSATSASCPLPMLGLLG